MWAFLYNDYAGKSDVMNEFMEYVYCLMYVGGITYSIKRVNSNVRWNARAVSMMLVYSLINMILTNSIDVSNIIFMLANMFSIIPDYLYVSALCKKFKLLIYFI